MRYRLLTCNSNRGRLHRCDYEGSPKVYQMVGSFLVSLTYLLTAFSLYVYNKIDQISLEHLDKLAREPYTAIMSCELDLGVDDVVEKSWQMLNLIRIYTKRKGINPDFGEALIVRQGSTIEDVCDQVHRTLKDTFKHALVWGASARHVPQKVGLSHMVADEDVVSIVA